MKIYYHAKKNKIIGVLWIGFNESYACLKIAQSENLSDDKILGPYVFYHEKTLEKDLIKKGWELLGNI